MMQSTGQGATHSSQPVHSSAMTVCMRRGAPAMASTGQGGRHLVQPMQRSSSMNATVGAASRPLSRLSGEVGRPVSAASATMVSVPPGGHWLMSASPRAIASAYGKQPV